MRTLPGKRKLSGFLLAAMAAGGLTLPVVAAQSASTQPAAKAPAHKPAGVAHSSTGRKSTGKASSKKRSRKVKGQTAPTPERISEIQEALAKKGALDSAPTGKWDDGTTDAVRKFQSSNGLNATGKLDALTLQKLGLGSETAGLAPPTPPPHSINRLRNTTSSPAEPQEPDSEPHN